MTVPMPPPSPDPALEPPPSRPGAPWPALGFAGLEEGRGTAGAGASVVGAGSGDGACDTSCTVGWAASAAAVFSGEAFTLGAFERTALGPDAFLSTLAGAGALCSPISVRAKPLPACCDARFRSDVEAA